MTADSARTTASAALVVGGVAAAYVILTTPSLRRLAANTTRAWLGGASIPEYLAVELGRAWEESRQP